MLQERPSMVASSCLAFAQATGVSGQVITKVISGPSQQAAENFRGWGLGKKKTSHRLFLSWNRYKKPGLHQAHQIQSPYLEGGGRGGSGWRRVGLWYQRSHNELVHRACVQALAPHTASCTTLSKSLNQPAPQCSHQC